MFQAEFC